MPPVALFRTELEGGIHCAGSDHTPSVPAHSNHKQNNNNNNKKRSGLPRIHTQFSTGRLSLMDVCPKHCSRTHHVHHVPGCRIHLGPVLVVDLNTLLDEILIGYIW